MAKKIKVYELKDYINQHSKTTIKSKNIVEFLKKTMNVSKTHSSNPRK